MNCDDDFNNNNGDFKLTAMILLPWVGFYSGSA